MADLVVVLERGRVAEVGSHDELLTRGDTYAELFSLQAAALLDRPTWVAAGDRTGRRSGRWPAGTRQGGTAGTTSGTRRGGM